MWNKNNPPYRSPDKMSVYGSDTFQSRLIGAMLTFAVAVLSCLVPIAAAIVCIIVGVWKFFHYDGLLQSDTYKYLNIQRDALKDLIHLEHSPAHRLHFGLPDKTNALILLSNQPLFAPIAAVSFITGILVLGWFLYRLYCGLWMKIALYRYGTLIAARVIGPTYRWLTSSWRPLLLTLFLTHLAIAIINPDKTEVPNSAAGAAVTKKPDKTGTLEQLNEGKNSNRANAATHWEWVMVVYTLLLLAWTAIQTRSLTVIEEFTDYTTPEKANAAESTLAMPAATTSAALEKTGKESDGNKTTAQSVASNSMSSAKGIAALLADHLSRLRDLYRNLDQQTAVYAKGVDIPVRDANLRTDNISDMFKDAVPADSKFKVGILEIPIGLLMKLLGRVAQGPRIVGSLHREGAQIVLTAKIVGGQHPYSWRVDSGEPLNTTDGVGNKIPDGPRTLDDMIAELACRIFTDIALKTICVMVPALRGRSAPSDLETC